MPRIGRVVVPNMPHHVVQRGHNRNAVFVDDGDYSYYLDTLGKWTQQLQVKVYAWCLMTNHVYLLLDPRDDIKSIGLLMKRLAGRQTRFVNRQENRTGSLWDGRYKMSIVDSDQYFLRCCRYIELNPVKAKMVIRSENYRWSSYRENAGFSSSGIVYRHGFTKLNGISFDDYRNYVAQDTPSSEAEFISQRLESNRLTGGDRFVKEIESRTGIRLEYKRPGRPPINKVIDKINLSRFFPVFQALHLTFHCSFFIYSSTYSGVTCAKCYRKSTYPWNSGIVVCCWREHAPSISSTFNPSFLPGGERNEYQ